MRPSRTCGTCAPGAKKAAVEEVGGMRKRKKVESVVEVRRSGRESQLWGGGGLGWEE